MKKSAGFSEWKRAFGAIFLSTLLLVMLLSSSFVAYANSAPTSWSGTTASGTLIMGDNCPLLVKNENIVFDIPSLPKQYYESETAFLDYDASVSAEYKFYNPTNDVVNANLAFPFGNYPSYGYYGDDGVIADDTAKYDVLVDGMAVAKTLRYTYSNGTFDTVKDVAKLRDTYVEDEFYQKTTTVTKYSFVVDVIAENALPSARFELAVSLPDCGDSARIIVSAWNGYTSIKGNVVLMSNLKDGDTYSLYVIGEDKDLNIQTLWNGLKTSSAFSYISDFVTFNFQEVQILTFEDLAMSNYVADNGVSQVDWYNAVVDKFNESEDVYDNGFIGTLSLIDVGSQLMRWYSYDISVPAKGEIINTVTAPLYPTIATNYSSPVYTYNYLLSPAKTWALFENLNIDINAPYYLTDNNQGEFTKGSIGYELSLTTLPEGELTFALSTEANPTKVVTPVNWTQYLLPLILVVCGVAVVIVVVFSFISIAKRQDDN